jgi:hypothetical protein
MLCGVLWNYCNRKTSHTGLLILRYFKKIRTDENDDRKVAHSLRHNLTGLLFNLTPTPSSEVMNWITGHGAESNKNESERVRPYQQDVDLRVKYDIINQIKHGELS